MSHRILIVDDSSYARRALKNMVEEVLPDCTVSYAGTGDEGLGMALREQPDLIFLDLEMPRMDGFTFLRILMAKQPTPVIIVSSRDDRESVLKALELGALDFIAKPTRQTSTRIYELVDQLRDKLQAIDSAQFPNAARLQRKATAPAEARAKAGPLVHQEPSRLICIGASTGGPGTLNTILDNFVLHEDVTLVIVQHMPAGFTEAFAQRLNRSLPYPVREIRNLDRLDARTAYICPGGWNSELSRGRDLRFRLREPDSTTRFVPSVDVMLASIAPIFGPRALGVVLTGMGSDGTAGARELRQAGGVIVVEDPETALVNGMPLTVVEAGLADHVQPVDTLHGLLEQWELGLLPGAPKRDGS